MLQKQLPEAQLTGSVIGAFYEVYNTLGFGFLEHIYKAALERELLARGHKVAREVAVVVLYKGQPLAVQRLDMIVDDKVVVESKSTAELHPSAPATSQLPSGDHSGSRARTALRATTEVLSSCGTAHTNGHTDKGWYGFHGCNRFDGSLLDEHDTLRNEPGR